MNFRQRYIYICLVTLMIMGIYGSSAYAAKFTVQRPGKLNIPRNIKKVFINPEHINDTNDKLKLKSQVIISLVKKLNNLGRFDVIIGPPRGFDPNQETVAIIQGDVISGGETDNGQLTEKAVCQGGLSGLVGAVTAKNTSKQGITISRRRMLCKKPSLVSKAVESGIATGLSLLGVQEYAPIDEVIRVYKYKNVSLFAQVNLSFTQIGTERETLTIRADAASFSRHTISPGSFKNVRESGDNAPLIWLWFKVTPIAPVVIRDIGVVKATNPDSYLGKWYDYIAPDVEDIPSNERTQIIAKLVNKTITQFIQTISPYHVVVDIELADGGNSQAKEKIQQGKYQQAKNILKNSSDPDDLYNLGLSFEAGATSIEDYQDAMRYYGEALDKKPGVKLYAQGIGRMEFQLRIFKKR